MNGWKALVMIVAILAFAGVALYIFDEIKKAKIQQAQAEAVTGFISGFIPGKK